MFLRRKTLSVNFAPDQGAAPKRTAISALVFTVLIAVISGLAGWISFRALPNGSLSRSFLSGIGSLPVLSDISRLVFADPDDPFAHIPDQKMNVMIFGIGGEGHDGPLLTDTIILAEIDLKEKKVALISIPRDLAYPLGEGRFEKINAVNAYAELEYPGEGARRAAADIGRLLDVRIDHVARVDFRAFSSFIDAIDGIDVNVERSFTDPQFPTRDEKWKTVSFEKGLQHMDGEAALNFVRSRHGTNGEGSDFARSRRQQIVMLAVRQKLLRLNTLADPRKLSALYSAITNHIQTDLSPWQALKLTPLAADFSADRVSMRVLTDDPETGELTDAMVNGAFMFFPRKPDWSEIREIIKNPYATSTTAERPAETIKLEVKNGTLRTGLAAELAAKLEKQGYEVTAVSNAQYRAYEQNVIFDFTGGKKQNELARLRKMLGAIISVGSPVVNASGTRLIYGTRLTPERLLSNPDFLIILGEESYPLVNGM